MDSEKLDILINSMLDELNSGTFRGTKYEDGIESFEKICEIRRKNEELKIERERLEREQGLNEVKAREEFELRKKQIRADVLRSILDISKGGIYVAGILALGLISLKDEQIAERIWKQNGSKFLLGFLRPKM